MYVHPCMIAGVKLSNADTFDHPHQNHPGPESQKNRETIHSSSYLLIHCTEKSVALYFY